MNDSVNDSADRRYRYGLWSAGSDCDRSGGKLLGVIDWGD